MKNHNQITLGTSDLFKGSDFTQMKLTNQALFTMGTSSASMQRLNRAQGISSNTGAQQRVSASSIFGGSRSVNVSMMAAADSSADQSMNQRRVQQIQMSSGFSNEAMDNNAMIFPSQDSFDQQRSMMFSGSTGFKGSQAPSDGNHMQLKQDMSMRPAQNPRQMATIAASSVHHQLQSKKGQQGKAPSKMTSASIYDFQAKMSQDFAKSKMSAHQMKKESPRFDIKSILNGTFTINEGHMLEEFAAGLSKNFNLNGVNQKGSTSFLQKAAMNAMPLALSLMVMNEPQAALALNNDQMATLASQPVASVSYQMPPSQAQTQLNLGSTMIISKNLETGPSASGSSEMTFEQKKQMLTEKRQMMKQELAWKRQAKQEVYQASLNYRADLTSMERLHMLTTDIMDSVMSMLRMVRNFFIAITPPVIFIVLWASYGDLTRKRIDRFKAKLFQKKVETKFEGNNESLTEEIPLKASHT